MLQTRKSDQRGFADHGWLKSFHSFSFAGYYDANHTGFASLRVINEDRVAPGKGFGTHPHHDMEIISYVLEGELEHKDNMGNGSVIRPGDVQCMSAGTGVLHSEFNPSSSEAVHFLQIWIEPNAVGIPPGYQQRHFDAAVLRGNLRLLVSPDGRDDSLTVHQDAYLYAAKLDAAEAVQYSLTAGRRGYVFVARGAAAVNGQNLSTGDALACVDEPLISVERGKHAEVLLFDLA